MNQPASQFGAHELIGMQEALRQKSANVEMLSFLSQQVQDGTLRGMLEHHARVIFDHYSQGVRILQGHSTNQTVQQTYQQIVNSQPKLGLRNPSMPVPNTQAGTPSEQTIATTALGLHKYGTIAWTNFALECTNPQLRTYLMNGAAMCDRMAYEVWNFMNQKEYYQVPTLQANTTQSIVQSYQVPSGAAAGQGRPASGQIPTYQ